MAKLHQFVQGEANWVAPLNSNFDLLNQDTGWLNVVTVAPVTGSLAYRVKNGIIYVRGSIIPNQTITTDLLIGKLPANIFANIGVIQGTTLWTVAVTGLNNTNTAKIILHGDGGLYIVSTNGPTTQPIVINISFTIE